MQTGTCWSPFSPDKLIVAVLLNGLYRSSTEEFPENFQRADQIRLPGSVGAYEHHEPA